MRKTDLWNADVAPGEVHQWEAVSAALAPQLGSEVLVEEGSKQLTYFETEQNLISPTELPKLPDISPNAAHT